MENTLLIEITNPKVLTLLQDLEELKLIKVLTKKIPNPKSKLSEKYRGVLSKQTADKMRTHFITEF